MHTQETTPAPGTSKTSEGQQQWIPQITIAVMGATGSGKTSFINMASGSSLRIGMDLESCTEKVELADEFILDGRPVTLIDTPGFDDTHKSDTDILKSIAAFLATAYEAGSMLAGVIYIHRISDNRFGGIAGRNFYMFRELCGDTTLKNVVLVTNMWGEVSQDVGEARERKLTTNFFKPALDKGAQLARHHNTIQSAHDIIRSIMKNRPTPLQIQRELVDEHKDIIDTAAGESINKELKEQIKRYQGKLEAVREDMAKALKKKDEEITKALEQAREEARKDLEEQRKVMRQELEEETRTLQEQISRMETDSKNMASKYQEEKTKMEEVLKQMEEQAQKERERTQNQIDQLQHQWDTRPQEGGCLIM